LFQAGRDDDLAFRFGVEPGTAAMVYLTFASWPLGEVDRAISLIDRMQTRMADLTHVGTLAIGRMHAAMFEFMRGDHARGAPNAVELVRLTGEQELPMFRAYGVLRIPTKPAMHSNMKPATYSDPKPAGVPI
ncbi:MAG TPA: hypothetical protein VFE60_03640, partial [Roseiarcus sp.]|nr:hypothetical protein [Roseiarcus sp.]